MDTLSLFEEPLPTHLDHAELVERARFLSKCKGNLPFISSIYKRTWYPLRSEINGMVWALLNLRRGTIGPCAFASRLVKTDSFADISPELRASWHSRGMTQMHEAFPFVAATTSDLSLQDKLKIAFVISHDLLGKNISMKSVDRALGTTTGKNYSISSVVTKEDWTQVPDALLLLVYFFIHEWWGARPITSGSAPKFHEAISELSQSIRNSLGDDQAENLVRFPLQTQAAFPGVPAAVVSDVWNRPVQETFMISPYAFARHAILCDLSPQDPSVDTELIALLERQLPID